MLVVLLEALYRGVTNLAAETSIISSTWIQDAGVLYFPLAEDIVLACVGNLVIVSRWQ